jgi:bidirectional [NiFe] hydrogenase diaphorase subunit
MLSLSMKPPAPTADKRWKIIDAAMRRHGHSTHALIETLHTAQEAFGYLDKDALRYVAAWLRVPLSQVYGVATFYHYFSLKPPGEHTCVVCTGTACYIKGAGQLLDVVTRRYGVEAGETTADGKLSVLEARCIGSCGLAPAAVFDNDVAAKVTPELMLERVGKWMSK